MKGFKNFLKVEAVEENAFIKELIHIFNQTYVVWDQHHPDGHRPNLYLNDKETDYFESYEDYRKVLIYGPEVPLKSKYRHVSPVDISVEYRGHKGIRWLAHEVTYLMDNDDVVKIELPHGDVHYKGKYGE